MKTYLATVEIEITADNETEAKAYARDDIMELIIDDSLEIEIKTIE